MAKEMRDISLWAPFGWLILAAGIGLVSWGWVFDPTIPALSSHERVLNVGLLSTKTTILFGGGLAFCLGVVILQIDGARRDLRDMFDAKRSPPEA